MIDWRAIVAEHGPVVWQTAFRLLNHHADASDCYQETWLAAYRATQRKAVANWRAFLIHLATRRAIDRLRQRMRTRHRFMPIHRVSEPASEAISPLEHAQVAERLDCIRSALAELPEKQAEVFWLSCVQGLSHQEISAQLQIRTGEVRVLLHRARTRLRAALEPSLPERRNHS
jgi:RNA polymerase sigma-70 factor (ECF subfamily)